MSIFKEFCDNWKTLWVRAIKIGNFPSSWLFFESKFYWIFTKIFISERQSRKTFQSQNSWCDIEKSIEYTHWGIKIFWVSFNTIRNSTTLITLVATIDSCFATILENILNQSSIIYRMLVITRLNMLFSPTLPVKAISWD